MSALMNSGFSQVEDGSNALREWTLYLTRTADKAQKNMDKPLRILIRDALLRLCQDPERLGERLSQPLTSVFSHHITYKGKEFRIAYQLSPETESVVILLIGPHENFYRKLKNLLYAS
ncbi:type II toxin-antitoxin system RelE/ParE family toxin [Vampirovibrio sp.]|uniref:type II toxin-antitoxin system RelE/ParE family toxin n=1 Tax=Vampirovibrio sp. TaxID=2717857 RepID=UPI003592FF2F